MSDRSEQPWSDDAFMSVLDWGSVPTWVATVGALAAVGFTGRTYVLNRQQKLQEQASKVACWIAPVGKPSTWSVALINGSDLPVYSLIGRVTSPRENRTILTIDMDVLPPTQQPIIKDVGADTFDPLDLDHLILSSEFDDRAQAVPIRFRDSAGVNWRRDNGGRLHLERSRRRVRMRRRPTLPQALPPAT